MNEKQNKQYVYNNNNFINKNMSIKNNSQALPNQGNNYYYNTKINHLIFHQNYSNYFSANKKISENYILPFNNVYLNSDIFDSNLNLNDGNNIITRNLDNSYYKNSISLKKSYRFKNMKINLNETVINSSKDNYGIISSISTTRDKNTTNSSKNFFYEKNIMNNNNSMRYNKKNFIKSKNSFKGENKLIKNNDNEKNINGINTNKNEVIKNYRIRPFKTDIQKKINEIKKNNNNTYIDLMPCKNNNNNYFYNIQNNYEKNGNGNKPVKNDLSEKKNIFLNNLTSINSPKNNFFNN